MLDADTNDNGFPAFAICKFVKSQFSWGSANHSYMAGLIAS